MRETFLAFLILMCGVQVYLVLTLREIDARQAELLNETRIHTMYGALPTSPDPDRCGSPLTTIHHLPAWPR